MATARRVLHRGNIVAMKIRIFILDDHELVRTGLKTLLDARTTWTSSARPPRPNRGWSRSAQLQPDVAILDVRLPDGSGIEVCREIRSLYPDMACLMLTSYADDDALFSAIMAGAAGYVLKEIGGSDLIGDIRRVSQGRSLIDANLSKEIFDRLRKSQKTEARLSSLSPQERRVLDLIAQGRSNRQIAEEIFLAEKTVKNYVSSLLAKLGMQRRTEAGVYAAILAERKSTNPSAPPPEPSSPAGGIPCPGAICLERVELDSSGPEQFFEPGPLCDRIDEAAQGRGRWTSQRKATAGSDHGRARVPGLRPRRACGRRPGDEGAGGTAEDRRRAPPSRAAPRLASELTRRSLRSSLYIDTP